MQFDLNYHDGIFEVTTSGDATLQGFADFAKAILEHEGWEPGGLILVNHTDLNAAPLTVSDIQSIAKLTESRMGQLGEAKFANLVGRDLEYGMTRMWQVFVEPTIWPASEKLFRDRNDAVTWLKKV